MRTRLFLIFTFGAIAVAASATVTACGDALPEDSGVTQNPPKPDSSTTLEASFVDGGVENEIDGAVADDGSLPNPVGDGAIPNPLPDAAPGTDCTTLIGIPATTKIVFLTEALITGHAGSISAYDKFCNDAAQNASIGNRTFVAFMHEPSPGPSPMQRVDDNVANGWVRTDGLQVFAPAVGPDSANPAFPISFNEHCVQASNLGAAAWTGLEVGFATLTCGAWNGPLMSGGIGNPAGADLLWKGGASSSCTEQRHIYCFQSN